MIFAGMKGRGSKICNPEKIFNFPRKWGKFGQPLGIMGDVGDYSRISHSFYHSPVVITHSFSRPGGVTSSPTGAPMPHARCSPIIRAERSHLSCGTKQDPAHLSTMCPSGDVMQTEAGRIQLRMGTVGFAGSNPAVCANFAPCGQQKMFVALRGG